MGDMADFALSSMDLFDEYHDPSDGPFYPTSTRSFRYCGMEGLTWGSAYGKWMLFEPDGFYSTKFHECPKNPYKPRK